MPAPPLRRRVVSSLLVVVVVFSSLLLLLNAESSSPSSSSSSSSSTGRYEGFPYASNLNAFGTGATNNNTSSFDGDDGVLAEGTLTLTGDHVTPFFNSLEAAKDNNRMVWRRNRASYYYAHRHSVIVVCL